MNKPTGQKFYYDFCPVFFLFKIMSDMRKEICQIDRSKVPPLGHKIFTDTFKG